VSRYSEFEIIGVLLAIPDLEDVDGSLQFVDFVDDPEAGPPH